MATDLAGRILGKLTDPDVGVGTLLVCGEAGMGKTHVLHQLAMTVQQAGGQVGWCQCNHALGGPPQWEWRSAIGELDNELPPSFPGADGREAFQSTWQWLEAAGAERPTLIVLDDLHDASSSAIDLFEQIGRRPRSAPWLVVGAARTSGAGDDASSKAVGRLAHMNVDRTLLKGLDAPQVIALAASMHADITSARAEELVRFTGGNPLFIRRILETGGEGLEVSAELLSFIAASIGELDPTFRPVAEALSVLGVRAGRATLQLMVPPERWPHSLSGDRTLIEAEGDVAFRHPLLREVVYDTLGDERRGELHALAAHAIEKLAGSPSLAAVHWSRASLAAQGAPAAETALRAGHLALEMGQWADAVSHFSHAGAVLEHLNDLDHRAASGAYRARALSMDGDTSAAMRALLDCAQAADVATEVSLPTRHLLVRELIRIRWREEPNPSTLDPAALVRAARLLLADESDAVSQSMLISAEIVAGEIGGLRAEHVAAARRGKDLLDPSADPTVRGEAALALRRALIAQDGTLRERLEASSEAVTAARASGDVELIGRSLRMLLTDAMGAGDRSTALSTIAAFDIAATTALREHQALGQASMAVAEGRYTDASDALDAAAKELSYVGREAPALDFARAVVALDVGGFKAAVRQYEPVLAVVADASLRAAFAYVAAADGNGQRATELIEGTLELLDNDRGDPLGPVSLAMIADAALMIGYPDVGRLLDMLEPFRGSCLTPANAAIPWLGSADRLIGLLEGERGDLTKADEALRASLAVHRSMQADPWVARSLVGLAAVSRSLGRIGDSDVAESEAAEIIERLGMSAVHVPEFEANSLAGARSSVVHHGSSSRLVHLERSGRAWVLRPEGGAAHLLPSLVGLGQAALLLEQPGREWHVLDLVAATAGAAASGTHAGELIDEAARRSYQNQMAVLRADLDEAERRSDIERTSTLLLQIDAIESQLLAAFGLGGRSRRIQDEAERARVNVRRNISRAVLAIEKADPVLGDHLRHRILTGRFCSYRPLIADPIRWVV